MRQRLTGYGLKAVRRLSKGVLLGGTAIGFALAATPASAQSNEEMMQRIRILENIVKDQAGEIEDLKKSGGAAKEQKGTVRSGRPGRIDVVVSGQVNRAVLYADDGFTEEIFHVDNDASSTRFRILGKGQYDEKFSAGTVIEVQMESNSSAAVSQFTEDTGNVTFTQRKLELYFDHKDFGRIWLGHGDTASNGAAEVDLSGTAVAALYSDVNTQAADVRFAEDTSAANSRPGAQPLLTGNPRIDFLGSNLDGFSRRDRVRYDTPSLAGFKLSTSLAEEDRWDVALRYAGEFGGIKVAAAAAYFHQDHSSTPTAVGGDFGTDAVVGSISALHKATGLNFTFAAGNQSYQDNGSRDIAGTPAALIPDAEDTHYFYLKPGWKKNIFGIGDTAIAFDYYEGNNVTLNGDYGRYYGGAIVQNIDTIATEIFISIRNYEGNREARQLTGGAFAGDNREFEDILTVFTGARIKF